LDIMLKEYCEKRESKKCKQDMLLISLDSMKDEQINKSVCKVIRYFTFTGTETKRSPIESNSVLLFDSKNINKMQFHRCVTRKEKKNFIGLNMVKYVLSLRGGKTPIKETELCEPWIYRDVNKNGSVKVCDRLHIRT
jgi:hypothetical protein